ncbi:MAG: glycosyltransferase family 4 protein [Vicinamibacterales bacterium]
MSRRILQVTSYPPPRAGWGLRVQFLKRALERDGHVCTVLNIGKSRFTPSPEYETVMSGGDFVRKVWRFSRQGFVLHGHVNGKSPKGFVLTLLAQIINLVCGRRSVLTFHAGDDQTYFPRANALALVPMFWLMFALPRLIICNSESVKRRIQEYGVPASKIHPIPAFSRQYLEFDVVPLPGDLEACYTRVPHVLFCYINLQPSYHPLVLLDAFERVAARRSDVALVLCGLMGHDEAELASATRERLRSSPFLDRIAVVEDLDHDEFLTALSRATAYIRTPPADGVASSVLESLALGTPVIASENGRRPPSVLTYPPEDAESLARAIEHVVVHRKAIVDDLVKPEIRDTLAEEMRILTQ